MDETVLWKCKCNVIVQRDYILFRDYAGFGKETLNMSVCMFGVCPTREFFTHIETSPLPVKGCKFLLMLGSRPMSSEGTLACHTYYDTSVYNDHNLRLMTLTPMAEL